MLLVVMVVVAMFVFIMVMVVMMVFVIMTATSAILVMLMMMLMLLMVVVMVLVVMTTTSTILVMLMMMMFVVMAATGTMLTMLMMVLLRMLQKLLHHLLQLVLPFNGLQNILTFQLVPRSSNNSCLFVILTNHFHTGIQLLLRNLVSSAQNNSSCMFNLVYKELTKVLNIHLTLGSIHYCNRTINLHIQICCYIFNSLHYI